MNRVLATDIGSLLANKILSAFASLTAGGTGDNTAVTGLTIDRFALGLPLSAQLVLYFEAVLAAAATLSITALKIEDSADGTNFATYVTLTAPGVVATGGAGGTTERGQVKAPVLLSSARRYVRVVFTPDLSAANTDTGKVLATATFAGFDTLPAG